MVCLLLLNDYSKYIRLPLAIWRNRCQWISKPFHWLKNRILVDAVIVYPVFLTIFLVDVEKGPWHKCLRIEK